jgi:hypothetical protein
MHCCNEISIDVRTHTNTEALLLLNTTKRRRTNSHLRTDALWLNLYEAHTTCCNFAVLCVLSTQCICTFRPILIIRYGLKIQWLVSCNAACLLRTFLINCVIKTSYVHRPWYCPHTFKPFATCLGVCQNPEGRHALVTATCHSNHKRN